MSTIITPKIFRWLLIAFLFGIGVGPVLTQQTTILLTLTICGLCVYILFQNLKWSFLALMMTSCFLGVWRYRMTIERAENISLRGLNGHTSAIVGTIAMDPEIKVNRQQVIIAAEASGEEPVTGKLIATVGLYPSYAYGDRVNITCQLEAPEPFEGFAYDKYLAVQGIYSQCRQPRMFVIDHTGGNPLVKLLMRIKHFFKQTIDQHIPEPQASLFYALNFGPRGGIPDDIYQAFQTTGTTHLIAISGSNIGIIISLLAVLATHLYIPRRRAFWVITALLVGYILMIGFPASALRAVLMGWVVLLAQQLGRLPNTPNALLGVASVMVWMNPLVLRDDLGFQLSFLAVIGLIYFSDVFVGVTRWLPERFGIREALQMTLAAQLTTTPLLLYQFGKLSLIAPIANIFLVPVLAYLVIAGLPLLFAAMLIPSLSTMVLWPVYLLVSYQIHVTNFLAAIPGALIYF